MDNESISRVGTVIVEHSDDRLAAVEEAKRTGAPLKSVGSRGAEIVPQAVADQIARDFSANLDYYVEEETGRTYAASLQGMHEAMKEDENWVNESNEEKAIAHHLYSAGVVRQRAAEDKKNLELQAQGFDFSLAVQQANLERAREHAEKSASYVGQLEERDAHAADVVEIEREAVKVWNEQKLTTKPLEERAAALEGVGTGMPDAMETPAQEALATKDRIIAIEEPYDAHVFSYDQLRPLDAPGAEIAQAAGSPEELRESTKVAQLYAGNLTASAREASEELEQAALNVSRNKRGKRQASVSAGERQRQAEDKVGDGGNVADEMPENPKIEGPTE